MKKTINSYKPVIDKKYIIEQAENNNMSVWEFIKGFGDIVDDTLPLDQLDNSRLYPEIKNTYKKG